MGFYFKALRFRVEALWEFNHKSINNLLGKTTIEIQIALNFIKTDFYKVQSGLKMHGNALNIFMNFFSPNQMIRNFRMKHFKEIP